MAWLKTGTGIATATMTATVIITNMFPNTAPTGIAVNTTRWLKTVIFVTATTTRMLPMFTVMATGLDTMEDARMPITILIIRGSTDALWAGLVPGMSGY